MTATIRLLQFRAAYNLPVYAAIETGIFARHELTVETAYTPGSLYIIQALKERRCDIGHTAADDIIADVENDGSDLFLFMGLHSGLFSLIGAANCTSIDSLFGGSIGVDAKTSGFALALERMLYARGFDRANYQLIEVGGWESRYRALFEGKITATLLTEPFVREALELGCNLVARDFEMIPCYQGTCGAASRRWAEQYPMRLTRYIQAYMEATHWCFDSRNRQACLDILGRYNQIDGLAAGHTLDGLLDPEHGLYPKAALNVSGVAAALELRAEMSYLARPIPPVDTYVDLSYYQNAVSIDRSIIERF